jgi:hypothetical protein
MSCNQNPPAERWVHDAIEQARIILAHLEAGGCDEDFLRPHALSLLQTIDLIPDSGQGGSRYLM